MARPILLSWSGGKDAAWTLHTLRASPEVEVVALVTTVTSGYDRIAMHGIRRDLLHTQAAATGLPVIEATIPPQCDNATYEAAFADALSLARARWPDCTEIAFGDLFLDDVRAWREALCARLGWTPVFPLFGRDTTQLARDMIDGGLQARLTCVDPRKLDRSFAGRTFDDRLLADLPAGIDPCGENGEFHSFAFAGPMFHHPIPNRVGEVVDRDGFVFADVLLSEPDRLSH